MPPQPYATATHRTGPGRSARDRRLRPSRIAVGLLLLAAAATGCRVAQLPLLSSRAEPVLQGRSPDARLEQVLGGYGLSPEVSAKSLAQLLVQVEASPSVEGLFAVHQLARKLAEKRAERSQAMHLHLLAATAAWVALNDPRLAEQRNPYDPLVQHLRRGYQHSVEAVVRLVQQEKPLAAGKGYWVRGPRGLQRHLQTALYSAAWHPAMVDRYEIASDYLIQGLEQHYRSFGLGAPLILVARHSVPLRQAAFFPRGMAAPATALLRPAQDDWFTRPLHLEQMPLRLEVWDTYEVTQLQLAEGRVPLEVDLSTPLAFYLHRAAWEPLAFTGFLWSEEATDRLGFFLYRPYEPGKVPVVFIHGLWSDPSAWAEMINRLQESPEIRRHYQFFFYAYPTGQPFWYSAAQLRRDLDRLLATLDPHGQDAALRRMILVGHSMGGLLGRMLTVESGQAFWAAFSRTPFEQIKVSPEVRDDLAHTFFFHPHRAVRCVVMIATPHRGSYFANRITSWAVGKVVTLPQTLTRGLNELHRKNPGIRWRNSPLRNRTSVDSLRPNSPALQVLLQAPVAPWVHYHNIVGLRTPGASGDGVVSLRSARLDFAATQHVVVCDHMNIHRHDETIRIVRRILLEHLHRDIGLVQPALESEAVPAP